MQNKLEKHKMDMAKAIFTDPKLEYDSRVTSAGKAEDIKIGLLKAIQSASTKGFYSIYDQNDKVVAQSNDINKIDLKSVLKAGNYFASATAMKENAAVVKLTNNVQDADLEQGIDLFTQQTFDPEDSHFATTDAKHAMENIGKIQAMAEAEGLKLHAIIFDKDGGLIAAVDGDLSVIDFAGHLAKHGELYMSVDAW